MNYQTVIGLEVHIQLKTSSKLFSSAPTHFGQPPNTQANLVDLAYPGVLPVLNEEVVNQAILFGLAIGAKIHPRSIFARKNYFYPDLPKGYQTSQFEDPIVYDGQLEIEVNEQKKVIDIVRAHLEEDAGKSLHDLLDNKSAIDLNRAGAPLLEIVTTPSMYCAAEALAYLKKLHQLVCYLGICDGNMQEGSFRCDVNISLRPTDQEELGTRAEIKNLNSFRFIEKAIAFEQQRQGEILSQGLTVVQQTRLFDESSMSTKPMRDKEDAHDYRYFPCPDLNPVIIKQEQIDALAAQLPRLPDQWLEVLTSDYKLSRYDAQVLLDNRQMLSFFEDAVRLQNAVQPKALANWLLSEVLGYINKHQISFASLSLTAEDMALLTDRVTDKTLSSKTAKQVLSYLLDGQHGVDDLIEKYDLKQVSDTATLEKVIVELIEQHQQQWSELCQGKDKLTGFFVGQAMKKTGGRANPSEIMQVIESYKRS